MATVGLHPGSTPPWFKKNLQVLGEFLNRFSHKAPLALEFQHESWFDLGVFEFLRNHGASLGVVESDKLQAVQEVTALPFIYMRLR